MRRLPCRLDRATHHFPPNVYELGLLPEQIDDRSDEMASYAEPGENDFVFGTLRYEPDEGFMLKPITKK